MDSCEKRREPGKRGKRCQAFWVGKELTHMVGKKENILFTDGIFVWIAKDNAKMCGIKNMGIIYFVSVLSVGGFEDVSD